MADVLKVSFQCMSIDSSRALPCYNIYIYIWIIIQYIVIYVYIYVYIYMYIIYLCMRNLLHKGKQPSHGHPRQFCRGQRCASNAPMTTFFAAWDRRSTKAVGNQQQTSHTTSPTFVPNIWWQRKQLSPDVSVSSVTDSFIVTYHHNLPHQYTSVGLNSKLGRWLIGLYSRNSIMTCGIEFEWWWGEDVEKDCQDTRRS